MAATRPTSPRRAHRCLVAAVAIASPAMGDVGLSVITHDDTFVTNHAGLGGPTSAQGFVNDLWTIGAGSSRTYYSVPLVRFDLDGVSGTVSSAVFNAYYASNLLTVSNDIALRSVLVNWAESTVTYNTLGPTAGVTLGTDVASTATSTVTLPGNGSGYFVPWAITASEVQGWMTAPVVNNGVALVPVDTGSTRDITFKSSDAGWALAPYLAMTFTSNVTVSDVTEGRGLGINGGHTLTVNNTTLNLHEEIRLGIDGTGAGSLGINGGTVFANSLIASTTPSQAGVTLNGGTLSTRSNTLLPSQLTWTSGTLELRDPGTVALPDEALNLSAGRTFRIARSTITGNATLQLSTLSIGIAGVGRHGKLEATHTAAGTPAAIQRGGVLSIYLENSFTPSWGQSFDLFDWGVGSGTFSKINLPTLRDGMWWDTSQLYTTGVVSVIPEPASTVFVASALGLLVRRRRSRNRSS